MIWNLLIFVNGIGWAITDKKEIISDPENSSFQGLSYSLNGYSTQTLWGWVLLLAGTLLLLYCSLMKESSAEINKH